MQPPVIAASSCFRCILLVVPGGFGGVGELFDDALYRRGFPTGVRGALPRWGCRHPIRIWVTVTLTVRTGDLCVLTIPYLRSPRGRRFSPFA